MRTPANVARHPIHPILVPIPIGLWIFSLVCDVVYVSDPGDEIWAVVAYYAMVGGIIGALLAAVPGFIDMLSLPRGPRQTALLHMSINLVIVALYAVNIWLRAGEPPNWIEVWLSVVAVGLLVISGWLGGKIVHGIAVDTGQRARPGQPRMHA